MPLGNPAHLTNTATASFSRGPLPQYPTLRGRPKLLQGKRKGRTTTLPPLPKLFEPETGGYQEPETTVNTVSNSVAQTSVVYVGKDLPLVFTILCQQKYLPFPIQSQVVMSLLQTGIAPIEQQVAARQSLIAGRLKLFLSNWRTLTNDPWVIACVQGYTIDLREQPYQYQPPRELTFPPEDTACLSKEVTKMIDKHAITPVPNEQAAKGFQSQLFTVPKKDGGTRPIINLKRLNSFVHEVHFKMEGIHMLKDILKPGNWMTKIDLKDAYFTIPMTPDQRRLLRFRWQGTTYQFNCLPFGLSSAPWVFTKTTKPIMTILRTMGLRLIIYIDDILLMAETQSTAREHTAGLVFLLEIINHPKSLLTPTQEIDFLGFTINSVTMEIKLPSEKIKKYTSRDKEAPGTGHPQGSDPISLARQVQSCHPNHSSSSPVLQEPTTLPPIVVGGGGAGLLNSSASDTGGHRGAGMVASTPDTMEWEVSTIPKTVSDNRNRCLQHRMGSNLSGSPEGRSLVKDQETNAHQLLRTTGRSPSCEVLCKGQARHNDPSEDGQHNCSHLHQQAWGHCVPRAERKNFGSGV